MTLYNGPALSSGSVALTSPTLSDAARLADHEVWFSAGGARTDTATEVRRWSDAAQQRTDILMFEIAEDGRPVGQIFLHDIDESRGVSLVGYHFFESDNRARGLGTAALTLLVDFARTSTGLNELVIITAGDNIRSRRIAEKSGFVLVGAPREDPNGLCLKLQLGGK
jgi:RimJ/RimL family protein N-acetyltransferase